MVCAHIPQSKDPPPHRGGVLAALPPLILSILSMPCTGYNSLG